MPENENTPSDKPTASEYAQPLVVALMAGIFGFGYVYYSSGDLTRSLTVGGVCILVLFWVVLRGNNLKKQHEIEHEKPEESRG